MKFHWLTLINDYPNGLKLEFICKGRGKLLFGIQEVLLWSAIKPERRCKKCVKLTGGSAWRGND